jgi:RNA polymerase sigma-70 factor (ECF subfamily)
VTPRSLEPHLVTVHAPTAAELREHLQREIPRLYAFAYLMCGSRDDALAHLRATVALAQAGELGPLGPGGDELIAHMARRLEEALGRSSESSFDDLDRVLRSDITRPIDVSEDRFGNDPLLVHTTLWELKRTCLTQTLGCLPPGVRLAFVLTDVLGYAPEQAATLLDIKDSAYRVRLTRARKRVEDYLTPRCYHVDRQNPCTCAGRLVIALDAGFVRPPTRTHDIPHEPYDAAGPKRDMGSLYRSLPQVALSDMELRALVHEPLDGL